MNEILKSIVENYFFSLIVISIVTTSAIVLILIVFMKQFHKQIAELMTNLGELMTNLTEINYNKSNEDSKTSVSALFGNRTANQPLPDKKNEKEPKDVNEKLHVNPWLSQTLLQQEESIWEDIKEKYLEKYPEQRNDPLIQLLVRSLASSQIREAFEFNHNFIHGSQIYLLRRINQRGPLPKNEMDIYFLDIQKQFPNAFKDHKTDDYLAFLLGRSLIIYQEELYNITPLGIEFLGWLTTIGRDENRPL